RRVEKARRALLRRGPGQRWVVEPARDEALGRRWLGPDRTRLELDAVEPVQLAPGELADPGVAEIVAEEPARAQRAIGRQRGHAARHGGGERGDAALV